MKTEAGKSFMQIQTRKSLKQSIKYQELEGRKIEEFIFEDQIL